MVLAGIVLVLSVFQLDSPVSLTADWLCRPAPRAELLTAKLLLVLLVTYAVRACAMLGADLALGLSFGESLLEALMVQDRFMLVIVPTVLVAAAVTDSLLKGFGALGVLFICVFVLPTPFVQEPGPLQSATIGNDLDTTGLQWLSVEPAKFVPLACAVFGLWLVYWRRRVRAARIMLVATAAVTVVFSLLPMFISRWEPVFAAQAALVPHGAIHDDPLIRLDSTRTCLLAARAESRESIGMRDYNGIRDWSEWHIRQVGPDTIVFFTSMGASGLPFDTRLRLSHVSATYLSAGKPTGIGLRPARYNTGSGGSSLSHSWALPGTALRRLEALPDVSLELRYSLALLEPEEFQLPTDAKRHWLPGLGYCGATIDPAANRIDVDCFMPFQRPAQISAELPRIRATRVYGSADYTPGWLRWPRGERVKLRIQSPTLGRHDVVTVTSWRVAQWLTETVTLPGILGGDAATCPLPTRDGGGFQQARWRDSAPHDVSSVRVDDDVQLEVLDFGGQGTPLLLLPGLGATAHAYDDLAPQLARTHRVVAMTRRGSGASSRPNSGYDTPRLARDVLRVMDAMNLRKVVLVGHSIAGDELTWLGGHHPERFAALVYLDAAYDRARARDMPDSKRLRELASVLPPEPPYPPNTFADYEAARKVMLERGHPLYPEGEMIAFYRANLPAVAGMANIDTAASHAISAAIESPDYGSVKIPALAIYADGAADAGFAPWYDPKDARLRAAVEERTRLRDAMQRENVERFEREMAHGQVIVLKNSRHNLFLASAEEVREAVERFTKNLPTD